MLKPGEIIEIDMRKLFMDDMLWVRVKFIKYLPTNTKSNHGDMLVEDSNGKQFVWACHPRRYPLK